MFGFGCANTRNFFQESVSSKKMNISPKFLSCFEKEQDEKSLRKNEEYWKSSVFRHS